MMRSSVDSRASGRRAARRHGARDHTRSAACYHADMHALASPADRCCDRDACSGRRRNRASSRPAPPAPRPAPQRPRSVREGGRRGRDGVDRDDYPAALACATAAQGAARASICGRRGATRACRCSRPCSPIRRSRPTPTRFVFASLDTDREANAAGGREVPAVGVADVLRASAPDEAVLARFVGAASVAQFHAFLEPAPSAQAGGAAGRRCAPARRRARDRRRRTTRPPSEELTAALAAAPRGLAAPARRADLADLDQAEAQGHRRLPRRSPSTYARRHRQRRGRERLPRRPR